MSRESGGQGWGSSSSVGGVFVSGGGEGSAGGHAKGVWSGDDQGIVNVIVVCDGEALSGGKSDDEDDEDDGEIPGVWHCDDAPMV